MAQTCPELLDLLSASLLHPATQSAQTCGPRKPPQSLEVNTHGFPKLQLLKISDRRKLGYTLIALLPQWTHECTMVDDRSGICWAQERFLAALSTNSLFLGSQFQHPEEIYVFR